MYDFMAPIGITYVYMYFNLFY